MRLPSKGVTLFADSDCDFFCCRVQLFQRKTDAYCISILYDTNDLPDKFRFKGVGYHYPLDKQSPSPSGLDGFPAIFTFPEVNLNRLQRDVGPITKRNVDCFRRRLTSTC